MGFNQLFGGGGGGGAAIDRPAIGATTLTGRAQPYAAVEVYKGTSSAVLGVAFADASGAWSLAVSAIAVGDIYRTSSGAGLLVVNVLGPTAAALSTSATNGSLIATISGLSAGETVTGVAPNDGRFGFSAGALLVGNSALSAGLVNVTVTTSANRSLTIAVNITARQNFTQAGKWYFASNRTRSPIGSATPTTQANNFMLSEVYLGDVPYAGTDFLASLPAHYTINQTGDNEFAADNTFNIQGVSLGVGPNTGNYAADRAAATWTLLGYNGVAGQNAVTVDPATMAAGVRYWGSVAIPAFSRLWVKTQFNAAVGAKLPYAYEPNTGIGEGQAGSATDNLGAKLLDGSSTNTSGRIASQCYGPEFVCMKSNTMDGRPVVHSVGDSIGFGKNEVLVNSGPAIVGGAGVGRGGSGGGFLARGLNDNAVSAQFLGANICIPGSGPSDVSVNGRVKTQYKWDAIKAVTTLNGGVVPATHLLCEAGTNSLAGTLAEFTAMMKGYYTLMRAEWPGLPIAQTTMICKATTNNGFQDTAGQTVGTIDRTDGTRFLFNDKLMNDRLDGAVEYAINTYQYTSDPTDRGKWAVQAGVATLQTALAAGTGVGNFYVNENVLAVGDFVSLDVDTPGSVGALGGGAHVTGITGTGPYQVFLNTNLTPANAQPVGAKVKPHLAADNAGLHPGTTSNVRTAKAITDWKNLLWAA